MIKQLQLKNFRGFEDHCLDFRELTVVVGANNAGKSTIVEALRIVSIVATRFKRLPLVNPPDWLGAYEGRASIGVSPSLLNLEINFESIWYLYDNPASITVKFENGSEIQIYVHKDGLCFASIYDQNGRLVSSQSRARDAVVPSVSIMPQIGPLRLIEEVLKDDYVRRVASSYLASLHFRNQLKVFQDYLPQLRIAVTETWPGMEIEELIVPGAFERAIISLHVRNEDFVGEIGIMGHGMQMWLQTIWFLCRIQGSDTVILDEPDVYLHADMQRRLIRYIRGRFPQILLTTHSVEIMAEVDPENILIVDRHRARSQYASSAPAVQSFVERIGSAHNVHLARLWSTRRLILVEGKDLKYLKILQNKLFPESQHPIDSIPNMPINGWGGWSYAIGSDRLMKNAIGDQIQTYCIFDRDYHHEGEIAQRHQQARVIGVYLHIWSKKEIENFFLNPSTIQRFIGKRVPRRINAPSRDEVANQIQVITDSLEDGAFDALSSEYLAADRGGGPRRANEKARTRLREVRDATGSVVDIISGKELISRLSNWSQTEFGVSFSASALLKEFNLDEIPNELIHVLDSIENSRAFR
jgi:hypothetical protein